MPLIQFKVENLKRTLSTYVDVLCVFVLVTLYRLTLFTGTLRLYLQLPYLTKTLGAVGCYCSKNENHQLTNHAI